VSSEQTDKETLDRIVRLAFAGSPVDFAEFMNVLLDVTPPDAEVVLRGSAVTGTRWEDGQPFDADGPGSSDLDITFIGGNMLVLWKKFYIPGLHSVPLSDEHPDACPTFVPVRERLSALARRPVNIQASRELVQYVRDVVFDQPYFTLVHKDQGRGPQIVEGDPTSDA
jgi:hypothetical protein